MSFTRTSHRCHNCRLYFRWPIRYLKIIDGIVPRKGYIFVFLQQTLCSVLRDLAWFLCRTKRNNQNKRRINSRTSNGLCIFIVITVDSLNSNTGSLRFVFNSSPPLFSITSHQILRWERWWRYCIAYDNTQTSTIFRWKIHEKDPCPSLILLIEYCLTPILLRYCSFHPCYYWESLAFNINGEMDSQPHTSSLICAFGSASKRKTQKVPRKHMWQSNSNRYAWSRETKDVKK